MLNSFFNILFTFRDLVACATHSHALLAAAFDVVGDFEGVEEKKTPDLTDHLIACVMPRLNTTFFNVANLVSEAQNHSARDKLIAASENLATATSGVFFMGLALLIPLRVVDRMVAKKTLCGQAQTSGRRWAVLLAQCQKRMPILIFTIGALKENTLQLKPLSRSVCSSRAEVCTCR